MLYYRVDDLPRVRSKTRWKEDHANNIFNTEEIEEDEEEGYETQLVTTAKKKSNQPKQRRKTDLSKVTCYDCQQKGHYAGTPACPNYKKQQQQTGTESEDLEEDEEAEDPLNQSEDLALERAERRRQQQDATAAALMVKATASAPRAKAQIDTNHLPAKAVLSKQARHEVTRLSS